MIESARAKYAEALEKLAGIQEHRGHGRPNLCRHRQLGSLSPQRF